MALSNNKINNTRQHASFSELPSNGLSNEEKESIDVGRRVGNTIEYEWFRKEGNRTRYYKNQYEIHSQRLYATGDQSIEQYKTNITPDGDTSYLNLDWSIVPVLPKFVDILVNNMYSRDPSVKVEALDEIATLEKKRFRDRLIGEMKNKDLLNDIQQKTGVKTFEFTGEDLPENNDEAEIYLQLNGKQGIEIAMEEAIDFIFSNNRFLDEIKYRVDYDLVTIGLGAVKHSVSPNEGVIIEYVDPANLVYSHTNSKYYDDLSYVGEIKRIPVTYLMKMFKLTPEQVSQIENTGESWYEYNNINLNDEQRESNTVDVLFYNWRTTEDENYKIRPTNTGGEKAIYREDAFYEQREENSRFEASRRVHDVIYEGVKVLGSDVILKWDKAKNMIRKTVNAPTVEMPYVIGASKSYNGRIYSHVDYMRKAADELQLIHVKKQQIIQHIHASGVFIDADGLAEIDLGNGTQYNPSEALKMYFQTGSVIGRSLTEDGDLNRGRIPIQELPGDSGVQLRSIIEAEQNWLDWLRQYTGISEAVDGTAPDPKALVGTQKLAAKNSQSATRHIVFASDFIVKRTAEGSALRVKDLLEYHPNKNDFINAIGRNNVEILEKVKDLHIHEYGINIEIAPDDEEKALLELNLQKALDQGLIMYEDYIDVKGVKSTNLGNRLFKYRRDRRVRKEQEMQQQNIQAQAQANAQSAQAKAQAEAQAEMLKADAKIKVVQAQAQVDMAKLEKEAQLKSQLQAQEFQYNQQLQGQLTESQQFIQQGKNSTELKKEKTKQKSTFESSGNDVLGGISLEGFGPS